jgi:NADH-quinone oxidoreductase subunit E
VCTNLPCSLRGARELLRRLEAHLGVPAGEATPDGRLALGHEECLGACAYAPMMRVDDTYHEDLDFEKARRILDGLD